VAATPTHFDDRMHQLAAARPYRPHSSSPHAKAAIRVSAPTAAPDRARTTQQSRNLSHVTNASSARYLAVLVRCRHQAFPKPSRSSSRFRSASVFAKTAAARPAFRADLAHAHDVEGLRQSSSSAIDGGFSIDQARSACASPATDCAAGDLPSCCAPPGSFSPVSTVGSQCGCTGCGAAADRRGVASR